MVDVVIDLEILGDLVVAVEDKTSSTTQVEQDSSHHNQCQEQVHGINMEILVEEAQQSLEELLEAVLVAAAVRVTAAVLEVELIMTILALTEHMLAAVVAVVEDLQAAVIQMEEEHFQITVVTAEQ